MLNSLFYHCTHEPEICTKVSINMPCNVMYTLRMYCIDRPGVPESRDACTLSHS